MWFRLYQDKSIRGLQIVSQAVEAKRRVCMASSVRFLMKLLFVCALIVWAAVLLSVPQRLYQSPGPHTPWGCVAAINAASQTERFVVSSISICIGVGSNSRHGRNSFMLHNLPSSFHAGSQIEAIMCKTWILKISKKKKRFRFSTSDDFHTETET